MQHVAQVDRHPQEREGRDRHLEQRSLADPPSVRLERAQALAPAAEEPLEPLALGRAEFLYFFVKSGNGDVLVFVF